MNIDDATAERLAKVLLSELGKGAYVGTQDSDLDDITVDGDCDLIAASRAVVEAFLAPPTSIVRAARTAEDVRKWAISACLRLPFIAPAALYQTADEVAAYVQTGEHPKWTRVA